MKVIQMEDVTKDYGNGKGIFNISLDIEEGEMFGYVGTNGAGKTTTLRSILGFIKPENGKIRVNGIDPPTPSPAATEAAVTTAPAVTATPAPTTAPEGTETATVTPGASDTGETDATDPVYEGEFDEPDAGAMQAQTYIGQPLENLVSEMGSDSGSEYADEPDTGRTGYHYYGSFTVSTTVDDEGNEVVSGVW